MSSPCSNKPCSIRPDGVCNRCDEKAMNEMEARALAMIARKQKRDRDAKLVFDVFWTVIVLCMAGLIGLAVYR